MQWIGKICGETASDSLITRRSLVQIQPPRPCFCDPRPAERAVDFFGTHNPMLRAAQHQRATRCAVGHGRWCDHFGGHGNVLAPSARWPRRLRGPGRCARRPLPRPMHLGRGGWRAAGRLRPRFLPRLAGASAHLGPKRSRATAKRLRLGCERGGRATCRHAARNAAPPYAITNP